MKKLAFTICMFVVFLVLAACGKKEAVMPAPAETTAGAGADTAAYPLPLTYEEDFQIDETTGVFHMIEPFEQNGAMQYVVLSGIMEESQYVTEQLTVTDGKTIFYAYDMRPLSLKAQRKEHFYPEIQDINFDGFVDFWIVDYSRNYYWLWDDAAQTFERNIALEALDLGYSRFDEEEQTIYSFREVEGAGTILKRKFQYKDGNPVLIGYTERVYDETQDKAITITYELQNGEMCVMDSVSHIIPRYYIDENTNTFSLVQIVPVQEQLPPFCITIAGELQDGRYYGKEAVIISLADGTVLQKIYLKEVDKVDREIMYPEFSSNAATSLILEDINFDGFLDMSILYDAGASNEWVRYWTWDKDRGVFQLDEALEALHLGSLFIDPKAKTFTSYWHDSVSAYTERTFQYIDGAPVLIRREEAVYDADRDKVITTIQERIDGEMKIVEVYEK